MPIKEDLENLKAKFISGNIPTETDFATLIDLVKKANAILGYDGGTNTSLKGLKIDKALSVELDANSGLTFQGNALTIAAGTGILLNENGVNIDTGAGLKIDTSNKKLQINAGKGFIIDKTGLKIDTGKGLRIINKLLTVDYGSGVELVGNKVSVKLSENDLKRNTSGLVKSGLGLAVNLPLNNAKNIGIDANGQLTLTTAALNELVNTGTNRFTDALKDAQDQSNNIGKVIIDETSKINAEKEWEKPLEQVIDVANKFGEGRIQRAKEYFEKQGIQKLANGRSTDSHKVFLNFSSEKHDDKLYTESGPFDYMELEFTDDKGISKPHKDYKGEITINSRCLMDDHFYLFIGMMNGDGKKTPQGRYLTSNAVMVYITEDKTYLLGYWDITDTTNPKWYLGETDPQDISRLNKALAKTVVTVNTPANGNISIPAIKLAEDQTWDVPITNLLKEANQYGQQEVERVIAACAEKLYYVYNDSAKDVFSPDHPAINFSFSAASENAKKLYSKNEVYNIGGFNLGYYNIKDNGSFLDNDILKGKKDKTEIDFISLEVEGYFYFIGNINAVTKLIDPSGTARTRNAILVHISKSFTSVIGHFDLTKFDPVNKTPPDFYLVEADPLYDSTHWAKPEISITEPPPFKVDDSTQIVRASGGNNNTVSFHSDSDNFAIDDQGKLTPKAWSDDKVKGTASQLATRTNNAVTKEFSIKIDPLDTVPFKEYEGTKKFRLKDADASFAEFSEFLLKNKGNPNVDIKLSSNDVTIEPQIVTNATNKIKFTNAKVGLISISAIQERTSKYRAQEINHSFEIQNNMEENNLEIKVNTFTPVINSTSKIPRFFIYFNYDTLSPKLNNTNDIMISSNIQGYEFSASINVPYGQKANTPQNTVIQYFDITKEAYDKLQNIKNLSVKLIIHQDATTNTYLYSSTKNVIFNKY